MNALASPNAIETATSVEPAVESAIKNFVEQELIGRPAKVEFDGERIKNSVALFSAKSIKELEGLAFELQSLQEYLKSETDRVQHHIDTALAGMQIIMDTISPWRNLRQEDGRSKELQTSAMRIALNGQPAQAARKNGLTTAATLAPDLKK
jgi:hypothetical protein